MKKTKKPYRKIEIKIKNSDKYIKYNNKHMREILAIFLKKKQRNYKFVISIIN
jgi:hypothetical protein